MIVNTDIDIDIADRRRLLDIIEHTPAMISDGVRKRKHNTGVYFHEVPADPFTGNCTIDHKEAERAGYFKLDILNVSLYEKIDSQAELDVLPEMEPMWELLEYPDIVSELFHIHNHYDIVKRLKPTSIEELAAVLAIIRPAKRYLLDSDWDTIHANVWTKPDDGSYYFKKSHAFSYALAITVQLNLLVKDFGSQD